MMINPARNGEVFLFKLTLPVDILSQILSDKTIDVGKLSFVWNLKIG